MTTNERNIRNLIATTWREFVDPTRDAPLIQSIRDHSEDRQYDVIRPRRAAGSRPGAADPRRIARPELRHAR